MGAIHKPYVIVDNDGRESAYATKQQAMSRWGSMPDGTQVFYRPAPEPLPSAAQPDRKTVGAQHPTGLKTVMILTMHEVYEKGHPLTPLLVTSSLGDAPELRDTDTVVTRRWVQVPE